MKLNWQNTAIIIGLVGGLISIPKSTIEGYHAIFRRPNVQVDPVKPVTLTYNQKLKSLTCSAELLVQNSGDKTELIQASGAHMGAPDDPSGRVPFSGTDIILKTAGGDGVDSVLAALNTAVSLPFEITVPLSDSLRGVFTQPPNNPAREFVLELVSKDGRDKYTVAFHFKLGADMLEQLVNPMGPGFVVPQHSDR
jgi:hypothetical protein